MSDRSSSPPRGRPRSVRARRAVLKAARELLDQGGLAAVTVEAVAARAGVGKPTIYRSWANRYEVAMAALIDGAPDADTPVQPDAPVQALRLQLRQMAALFDSALGRGVATMLASSESDSEVVKAFRNRFITDRRNEGRTLLETAREQGAVGAGVDLDLALDLIYGPFFYRLLMGHGALGPAYADAIIDNLMQGFADPSHSCAS